MAAAKMDPMGDLGAILGGKGGAKAPPLPMGDEETEAPEVTPAFETAAVEAFPEMEGDVERIAALKRAIHECLSGEEY